MPTTPSAHLHALWGKSDRKSDPRHPLLWHLLDTAAMAEVIWDGYTSSSFRHALAHDIGQSQADARAWFGWLTAMHDIGKAGAYFQGQAPGPAALARTAGMGSPHPWNYATDWASHEVAGLGLLTDWWMAHGLPSLAAQQWAMVASVEDGLVLAAPSYAMEDRIGYLDARFPEYGPVKEEIIHLVAEGLGVTTLVPAGPPSPRVALEAAGLIKVADWVASHSKMFPYLDEQVSVETYLKRARRLAKKAARRVHLHGWRAPVEVPSFSDQFGEEKLPRATQKVVIDVARQSDLGTLIVVEEEMGQGKTEAALGATAHFAAKGAQGLYFALPTRTTARSMHQRVLTWLERAGMGERWPILNVGQYNLMPPLGPSFEDESLGEPGQQSTREFRTEPSKWFRGHHRALLARVGVGTVDQVLLSAQPVRYWMVRLAGLSGRVVVFDEVHAYDVFQRSLFEGGLRWLAALGCPVVLLSATLPDATRQRFVNAYRSGLLGREVEGEEAALPEVGYPAVTVVSRDGIEVHHPVVNRESREITVEHLTLPADEGDDPTPTVVADRLAQVLGSNPAPGVALVICNRVQTAIETAQEMESRFPAAEVHCYHSRFTVSDRASREEAVLRVASKEGVKECRGERLRIIVATQVAEQSLDIDADLMITQVAPVDLVLQRAGRLHRWEEVEVAPVQVVRMEDIRPDWGKTPHLVIVHPAEDEGVPDVMRTSAVYAMTLPREMLRSAVTLKARSRLTFPEDIPALVREVYDGTMPDSFTGALAQAWRAADAQQQEIEQRGDGSAAVLRLPRPWTRNAWDGVVDGTLNFRSRDGEESVQIALAVRDGDGEMPWGGWLTNMEGERDDLYSWAMSTVSIPRSMHRKMSSVLQAGLAGWERTALADTEMLVLGRGGVSAGAKVFYGPDYGLRLSPED